MSKFIINPKSIDFNTWLQNIQDYVETKPDSATWLDFFDGSAGKIVLELAAGHAVYLQYHALIARRESFLRTMRNRTSVVGFAQNKGYSVFRGLNARVEITLIPSVNGLLEKFDIIGTVKNSDLIITQDTILIANQPVIIPCTIGFVNEEMLQAIDDKPRVFSYEQPLVSEDISVLLNDVEVQTSNRLIDASLEKFIIQSNPVGSVDVFYLNENTFVQKIDTSDEIKIKYIELDNTTFAVSDINAPLLSGVVTLTEITQGFLLPEELEQIKVNAPLYQETQFVVRAREDYSKILRLIRSEVVDSDFIDISPMVVQLYYIKDNLTLYTPQEQLEIIEELSIYRSAGLEPPTMGESIRNNISLNILIKIDEVNAMLNDLTLAIVSKYEKKLGTKIDFETLENQIEDLDGVRIVRVEIDSLPWQANNKYEVGQYANDNNVNNLLIFRAERIIYLSDSTEPVWPTTIDDTIIDGKIVWQTRYLERQFDPLNPIFPLVPPRPIWQANNDYKIGDVVIPTTVDIYEYVAVDIVRESGSIEPLWPALDGREVDELDPKIDFVYDNDLIWLARPLEGTPNVWQADTKYNASDVVVAIDPSMSDTEGVMFQCIGFVGTSNGIEPTWPIIENDTVVDGNILFRARNKQSSPAKLARTQYFIINSNITVTTN